MIHFVVALPAEARALIEHYRLCRRPHTRFPVYASEAAALAVAGVGKRAAAEATACLQALTGAPRTGIWLNVGIAGHRTRALAQAVLAHRIRDQSSARTWYPPLLFDVPCATENLLTVEQAWADYPQGWALDMEAAGFYPQACRFASAELVHVLKIISDNAANPFERIDAKIVARWIGEKLKLIDAIVGALRVLAAELPPAERPAAALVRFVGRWHFTVSQRHQLQRLLERWHALAPGTDPWCEELARAPQAAHALRNLEQRLRALPIRLT
jgi:adenosylhomocysteine nucleosidase